MHTNKTTHCQRMEIMKCCTGSIRMDKLIINDNRLQNESMTGENKCELWLNTVTDKICTLLLHNIPDLT